MRIALGFLGLTCLLLTSPACAAGPPAKSNGKIKITIESFATPDEVLRFIDQYRNKPEPERLAAAVQAMSRLGVFKEVENAGVYIGFMAGVLSANPKKAEALVTAMFPYPPEDQVAIVKAIAYSGLPDWKILLGKFVERMPARRILIDRYLTGKMLPLDKLGLETGPAALDANWGYYFATGSDAPVKRIVQALAWSREANDLEKLTMAGMAKWTLAKNATRDSDLLAILKREAATQPAAVGRELREVIEAVETFEVGKLRKDAIARIDELKAKGPESKRNASWWAQAGTTALALGCVAASVMGQVEFGLPCVIGGPLSTAAARLFIPQ